MLQNVTQGTTNTKQNKRIPQILEMELKGFKQGDIATNLGVSRMQIWRDKQTDLYTYFVNNWIERYENSLNEMLENGTPQYKNEATKEIGRMIRGTKTKQIESKTLSLHMNLQESRGTHAWVEHMTPQDFDTYTQIKDNALKRMNNPKT